MHNDELSFTAPIVIKSNVIRMGLAFLLGGWTIFFIFFFGVIPEIKSGRLFEELRWLWASLVIIGVSYGLKAVIGIWIGFWQECITVKIGDEYLTGTNMWGQPKKIRLDEIRDISKNKRNYSVIFTDKNNHKLIVSGSVEYFGTCIEEIAKRVVNVKNVNYAGMDKNYLVWRKRV